MKPTRGLASVAAWISAAVTGAVMLTLAAFDLARGAGANLGQHALHVLVIAGLVYFGSRAAFRRFVSDPIRQLESQLYRVGTGRLEPISVDSSIQEVKAIEHAANLMVQRMVMGGEASPSMSPAPLAPGSDKPEVARAATGAAHP